MTYYNLTFMDNTTSLLQIAAGVNNNSNGWMFGLLLFFFWIVMFMVFRNEEPKSVWVGTSFLTALVGGLLFAAGLLDWWVLIFPVIVLLISLIIKIWGDS